VDHDNDFNCYAKVEQKAATIADVSSGARPAGLGRRQLQGFNFRKQHSTDQCAADEFDARVQEVDDACCSTASDCQNSVPSLCSIGCAVVFDKFFTECGDLLRHFADETFGVYEKLEQQCQSQDVRSLIYAVSEVDCAKHSCAAYLDAGTTDTGTYEIKPPSTGGAVKAYCNMDTEGGGWTLVWTYTVGGAKQDFGSFWTSTRTSAVEPPRELAVEATGSFFDRLVPEPAEGFDLLLTCTNNGEESYLYYQDVDASRLVSPTTDAVSCAEQGTGLDCRYSYTSWGAPKVVHGFGGATAETFDHVINRTIHRSRLSCIPACRTNSRLCLRGDFKSVNRLF
jgi:hypothetical protein